MPGNNFGGIKAAPRAPGAELRTVEGHGAGQHEVTARFRSYDSAEAGAQDYMQLLATRYPAALSAAVAGNAPAFAHALAEGGYFTADPSAYDTGLQRRLRALEREGAGSTHGVPPPGALTQLAFIGMMQAFRAPAEDT